jgi:SH3-like domain-containing protein
MNRLLLIFLASVSCFFSSVADAADLPVPRFVTIKFNEVNSRTGPENDCPIEWVFVKKGEPVEIIAEYGQWRKIKDIKDEGGWVHSSVISGNRSVILVSKNVTPLISSPNRYDKVIAKLSPGIRCNLHKCKPDWCLVTCQSYKGWVARKFLWGVYPEEFVKK